MQYLHDILLKEYTLFPVSTPNAQELNTVSGILTNSRNKEWAAALAKLLESDCRFSSMLDSYSVLPYLSATLNASAVTSDAWEIVYDSSGTYNIKTPAGSINTAGFIDTVTLTLSAAGSTYTIGGSEFEIEHTLLPITADEGYTYVEFNIPAGLNIPRTYKTTNVTTPLTLQVPKKYPIDYVITQLESSKETIKLLESYNMLDTFVFSKTSLGKLTILAHILLEASA